VVLKVGGWLLAKQRFHARGCKWLQERGHAVGHRVGTEDRDQVQALEI